MKQSAHRETTFPRSQAGHVVNYIKRLTHNQRFAQLAASPSLRPDTVLDVLCDKHHPDYELAKAAVDAWQFRAPVTLVDVIPSNSTKGGVI